MAGVVGAAVSGVPSTTHALLTGGSPLEGARAAGSILLPRESRTARLVAAAGVVHLSLSLGWAVALARMLPAGRRVRWAPAAGLAIAALDLGVVGRHLPAIRALAPGPRVDVNRTFSPDMGEKVRFDASRPRARMTAGATPRRPRSPARCPTPNNVPDLDD